MLLPLGDEGTGGFESYPTSEIPNKYIYDAFLMIYLSILLLLFFHFLALQRSKLGIHKGCNSVRLQEKSQDNISKRAAVEKELLTLEKDKEDQSKYYLSYPKPPVLDMKWANCDINVVK